MSRNNEAVYTNLCIRTSEVTELGDAVLCRSLIQRLDSCRGLNVLVEDLQAAVNFYRDK